MILNIIAEKLKRRSKDDFKGQHFEAWLIVQAVAWYFRNADPPHDQPTEFDLFAGVLLSAFVALVRLIRSSLRRLARSLTRADRRLLGLRASCAAVAKPFGNLLESR